MSRNFKMFLVGSLIGLVLAIMWASYPPECRKSGTVASYCVDR